jgi:hypothetical protein
VTERDRNADEEPAAIEASRVLPDPAEATDAGRRQRAR